MAEESLTGAQKITMYRAGFLLYEINAFAHAMTPDGKHLQNLRYNSEPFQDMIKDRIEYMQKLRKTGFNDLQARQRINMLYHTKRGKASPWDFLKIEYQPQKTMSDSMWSTKMKAKSRITRTLGSGYGRRMQRDLRPRYQPIVRELPPIPE